MKDQILQNLNNPRMLESLYRENRTAFSTTFDTLYPEISEHPVAQSWHERLHFESSAGVSPEAKKELLFVLVAGFIAGLIAKIPDFSGIEPDYFYPRNIGFIFLPMLTAFFAWKQALPLKKSLALAAIFGLSALYLNTLPDNPESHTLILACIHMPLFLWTALGFSFTSGVFRNNKNRMDFLRFNGDLIVMTAIIIAAGGLLTGITIGLFDIIEIRIEDVYMKYVGIWGLSAAPIVGTYLVRRNPQLVQHVSPVVARVFTPLAFIMLTVYLGAVIYTGKDVYNDREFLVIFNLLLIGVMALIVFSIAEISKSAASNFWTLLLLALASVTIILNGIALSAIVFRISEWGITPNRLAVLGSNLLMLSHLLLVTFRLFSTAKDMSKTADVEDSIGLFLPLYSVWTFVVVFLFPALFGNS